MLLGNAKIVYRKKSEVNMESELGENTQDMCSWEKGTDRGESDAEEEQSVKETVEEKEDGRIEQLIELMKEINGKFNKQIKEVRSEVRHEIDGIRKEMQQTKESWESRWSDMFIFLLLLF